MISRFLTTQDFYVISNSSNRGEIVEARTLVIKKVTMQSREKRYVTSEGKTETLSGYDVFSGEDFIGSNSCEFMKNGLVYRFFGTENNLDAPGHSKKMPYINYFFVLKGKE